MDENKVEVVNEPVDEFEKVEDEAVLEVPAVEETVPVEEVPAENFEVVEPAVEVAPEAETDNEASMVTEFQATIDKLTEDYNNLKASFDTLTNERDSLVEQLNNLQTLNETLKASIENYEAAAAQVELEKKNSLIENYEKILDAEEINVIKDKMNDLSYEELEGKLAITFAHKQMAKEAPAVAKVPLQEPEESQFALLMKKYRKN